MKFVNFMISIFICFLILKFNTIENTNVKVKEKIKMKLKLKEKNRNSDKRSYDYKEMYRKLNSFNSEIKKAKLSKFFNIDPNIPGFQDLNTEISNFDYQLLAGNKKELDSKINTLSKLKEKFSKPRKNIIASAFYYKLKGVDVTEINIKDLDYSFQNRLIFSNQYLLVEKEQNLGEINSYSKMSHNNGIKFILNLNQIVVLDNYDFYFTYNSIMNLISSSEETYFNYKAKESINQIKNVYLDMIFDEITKSAFLNSNTNGFFKDKLTLNQRELLLKYIENKEKNSNIRDNKNNLDEASLNEIFDLITNRCIFMFYNDVLNTYLSSISLNSYNSNNLSSEEANKDNYFKTNDNSNSYNSNSDINKDISFNIVSFCFSTEESYNDFTNELITGMSRILNNPISEFNKTFFFRIKQYSIKNRNEISTNGGASNNVYRSDYVKNISNDLSNTLKNEEFIDNNFSYQKIIIKIAETNLDISSAVKKSFLARFTYYKNQPFVIKNYKFKQRKTQHSWDYSDILRKILRFNKSNENNVEIKIKETIKNINFKTVELDLNNNAGIIPYSGDLNNKETFSYKYSNIKNCSSIKLAKSNVMDSEEINNEGFTKSKTFDEIGNSYKQCCMSFKYYDPDKSLIDDVNIIICSVKASFIECELEIKYIRSRISERCNNEVMSKIKYLLDERMNSPETSNDKGMTLIDQIKNISPNNSENFMFSRTFDTFLKLIFENSILSQIKSSKGSIKINYDNKTIKSSEIDNKKTVEMEKIKKLLFYFGNDFTNYIDCLINKVTKKNDLESLKYGSVFFKEYLKRFSIFLTDNSNSFIKEESTETSINNENYLGFNKVDSMFSNESCEYINIFGSINKSFYKRDINLNRSYPETFIDDLIKNSMVENEFNNSNSSLGLNKINNDTESNNLKVENYNKDLALEERDRVFESSLSISRNKNFISPNINNKIILKYDIIDPLLMIPFVFNNYSFSNNFNKSNEENVENKKEVLKNDIGYYNIDPYEKIDKNTNNDNINKSKDSNVTHNVEDGDNNKNNFKLDSVPKRILKSKFYRFKQILIDSRIPDINLRLPLPISIPINSSIEGPLIIPSNLINLDSTSYSGVNNFKLIFPEYKSPHLVKNDKILVSNIKKESKKDGNDDNKEKSKIETGLSKNNDKNKSGNKTENNPNKDDDNNNNNKKSKNKDGNDTKMTNSNNSNNSNISDNLKNSNNYSNSDKDKAKETLKSDKKSNDENNTVHKSNKDIKSNSTIELNSKNNEGKINEENKYNDKFKKSKKSNQKSYTKESDSKILNINKNSNSKNKNEEDFIIENSGNKKEITDISKTKLKQLKRKLKEITKILDNKDLINEKGENERNKNNDDNKDKVNKDQLIIDNSNK